MKLTKGRLSKLYSKHKQTKRRFKVNQKRRGPQNTFRKRKPFNLDRKTLKKIRGGEQGDGSKTKVSTDTTQKKTGNETEVASASDNKPTESGTNTNVSMDTAKGTSENETVVASSRIGKLATEGEILGNEEELRKIISAINDKDNDNEAILKLINNNENGDIDLNPTVDGTTVLIAAARAGRQYIVDAILAKGGFNGINTKNTDGETALMVAVKGGHTNIVNNLLKAKPTPADVNITDNNGETALQIAQELTDSEEKTNIIAAINEASSSTSSEKPIVEAEATAVEGNSKDTTTAMPIAEATSVYNKDIYANASAPPETSNTTVLTDTATGTGTATGATASGSVAAAIENYKQAALSLQAANDALYAAMTKSGNDMNPSSLEATTLAANKIASASDN
jgi:hypothetical protein